MRIICTKDKIEAGFESEYQAQQFIQEYKGKGWHLCYVVTHYTGETEVVLRKY